MVSLDWHGLGMFLPQVSTAGSSRVPQVGICVIDYSSVVGNSRFLIAQHCRVWFGIIGALFPAQLYEALGSRSWGHTP